MLTPEEELRIARETAEYLQEKLERHRRLHIIWRDALKRQQIKVAQLQKVVAGCR